MPENVDKGVNAEGSTQKNQDEGYLAVVNNQARHEFELREKKMEEDRNLAKLRRKKYLGYLMQAQSAIGKQDLQKLRDIEESVIADRDLDLEYRVFLQDSIRHRIVGTTIATLRAKEDVCGLVMYERFVNTLNIHTDERDDYLRRISNGVSHILARMDYEQIRDFQNNIFLDSSIDNKARKELFDLTETLIKKRQEERINDEKDRKLKEQQSREAAEFYEAQSALTDLPLVGDRANFLEQGPTFPLDVEGVVAKFELNDFDKFIKFRRRVERGEYPAYKKQLMYIISAFQHEFSEEFKQEKKQGEDREKRQRLFQKTVRKYRTERRKPGANVIEANKMAHVEMDAMLEEIDRDPDIDEEEKEMWKGKIEAYLKRYPTGQSLVMSLLKTRFPMKS